MDELVGRTSLGARLVSRKTQALRKVTPPFIAVSTRVVGYMYAKVCATGQGAAELAR